MNKYLEKVAWSYNMDKEDRKILRAAYRKEAPSTQAYSTLGMLGGTVAGAGAAAGVMKYRSRPSQIRKYMREALAADKAGETRWLFDDGKVVVTRSDMLKQLKEEAYAKGADFGVHQRPIPIPRWYGEMGGVANPKIGASTGDFIPKSDHPAFADVDSLIADKRRQYANEYYKVKDDPLSNLSRGMARINRHHRIRDMIEVDPRPFITGGLLTGTVGGAVYGRSKAFENFEDHMQSKYGDGWEEQSGWK